ncbi:T9SS type A sorting domain-containing protein, partial [Bacteroidota bacterium]
PARDMPAKSKPVPSFFQGTPKDPHAASKNTYERHRNPETGKIPEEIARKEIEFSSRIPTIESKWEKSLAEGESVKRYGWKSRGPFNYGGRTRAVAMDIRNENIILSGGVAGGMWRSIDGGESWKKTTKPGDLHSVSYVIQDIRSGHEDTWYYSTGEPSGGNDMARNYLPYRGDGIFKSTDNGETWKILESTSTNKPERTDQHFDWIWRLAMDYSNLEEDEIYAAATGSIFRTVDGGESWVNVLNGGGFYCDVSVTSSGVVYASISTGENKGIYRSEDGVDWTKISPATWPDYTGRIVFAIAPSNENIVYFVADLTDMSTFDWTVVPIVTPTILLKYTYLGGDGAGSNGEWRDISNSIPRTYKNGTGYVMSLAVYPENENMVFLGGYNLWRSSNGFANSQGTQIVGDFPWVLPMQFHPDVHQVVFSYKNPKVAFAAHDGGVSRTSDVTKPVPYWESLDRGFVTTLFYNVAIEPNKAGSPRIMGGAHDHGTFIVNSYDPKADWEYFWAGDGGPCAFIDNGTKYLFNTYAQDLNIMEYLPGDMRKNAVANNWTMDYRQIPTRVNPHMEDELLVNPFEVDPNNDKRVFLLGGKKLFRINDITSIPFDHAFVPSCSSVGTKDAYWETIFSGNYIITALGVSKEPANIVYFGTKNGHLYKVLDANSAHPIVTPLNRSSTLPPGAYTSSIVVDPHNAQHVVISFCNYSIKSIFSTEDGGEHWINVSGNLEERLNGSGSGPAVYWVAILPENGSNTYFAGTTTGLYSTTDLSDQNDTGTQWFREGAETLGNVRVQHIVTREIDGEVVLATHGTGVWSRDFNTSTVDNGRGNTVPREFQLLKNYPNPFTNSTTINYTLSQTSHVRITITDSIGHDVMTLIDEYKGQGKHSIIWDGSNREGYPTSSGVYFVVMTANEKSDNIQILKIN